MDAISQGWEIINDGGALAVLFLVSVYLGVQNIRLLNRIDAIADRSHDSDQATTLHITELSSNVRALVDLIRDRRG